MAAVAFHLPVQAVGQYQVVGHGDAVGLHGVGRAVVEVAHVGLVEVRHALLRTCRHGGVGVGVALMIKVFLCCVVYYFY
jgi:hypothetical protein